MNAAQHDELTNPSRRWLLKATLAGASVLAAAGLPGCGGDKQLAQGLTFLREPDVDYWRATAAAVLNGSLPDDAAAREPLMQEIVARIDGAMGLMRPNVRAAVFELLDFVELSPVHGIGGYWGAWGAATTEQATGVLQSWSRSRSTTLRGCFSFTRGFITGTWFGMPQSWAATGYPGPPQLSMPAGVTS